MQGKCFLSILLLFLGYYTSAQPLIHITENTDKINLSDQADVFTDSSKTITFGTINSASFNKKFISGRNNLSKMGYGMYPMWFRFRINNHTNKKLIIVVDNAITVDLYHTQKGQDFHKTASIYQPFNLRDILSNKISFLVDVPTDSTVDYYLRIETNSGIKFPLILYTLNSWIKREHQSFIFDGIYVGIMLTMILYNFFIFLSIRDKSYLYYVLYVVFMTLTNLNIKSLSFEFLWPSNPDINHYINVAACLSGIFSIMFTMSFLQIRQHSPRLRLILLGIIVAYIFTTLIVLSNFQFIGFILTESISLIAVVLMWTAGFVTYRKGYKPAKYYLLAWTILLICVAIFLLKDYNILPYNNFTFNSITIGSALEAILLSLALADRISLYKKEKVLAQEEALASLKENRRLVLEQNILLEKKVAERTAQLKHVNAELQDAFQGLSQTQEQLIIYEKEKLRANYTKELVELEAQALRAQMNPHFIFNCLNSIKALIQSDEKQKSIDYLITFSKLIRTLFNNSDKRQVSLYDELETCRLYTQLEAVRLNGNLQYQFDINENIDLKSAMVPALILQPFIENAIWHGIVPKEKGKVWIRVDGDDQQISCEIDDDGIGRELSSRNKPANSMVHQSKGINLSQARLELEKILSDKKTSVEIIDKYENNKATGTKVIVTFSLQ